MIRRKWGAHLARSRRSPARPAGTLHGSSRVSKTVCAALPAPLPTPWHLARYVRIFSYCAGVMSVRSSPRPVRTRKKKFRTRAPSSRARSIMAGISSTFQSVTDMWREKSRPSAARTFVARTAPSQAPGRWRKASCRLASVESRERLAPWTPCSRRRRAWLSRRRTPFVPTTTVKPRSRPAPASAKRSLRRNGSPPVRIRKTLGLTSAISSITRRHSAVESSPEESAPGNADR